jgi:hypothetical protein
MGKNDDLRDRLFKVTSEFTGPQLEEPLPSLEHWEYESTEDHEPDPQNNREHPRKDVPVYGIFETEHVKFRASAKNISVGGVLIDPKINLTLNELINMTFVHRNLTVPVQIKGVVVRVGADGTGIQFNRAVPIMSSL